MRSHNNSKERKQTRNMVRKHPSASSEKDFNFKVFFSEKEVLDFFFENVLEFDYFQVSNTIFKSFLKFSGIPYFKPSLIFKHL